MALNKESMFGYPNMLEHCILNVLLFSQVQIRVIYAVTTVHVDSEASAFGSRLLFPSLDSHSSGDTAYIHD